MDQVVQAVQQAVQVVQQNWVGARDLQIKDADNPNRWSWNTLPEGEVAKLVGDAVLDIQGWTPTTPVGFTSKRRAYLVFKTEPNNNNIDKAYSTVGNPKLRLISLARDPQHRLDGWFEVALGDYVGTAHIHLKGIDDHLLKCGLVVRGVEVRDKF